MTQMDHSEDGESSSSSQFYQPPQDDQIRLLHLTRDKEHHHMDLSLRVVSLNETDPSCASGHYFALSYTWGDGKPDCAIPITNVEGETWVVKITRTLYDAINRIARMPLDEFDIWVDQLCINQESTEEKTQQVPLMRRVYGGSRAVMVWVGTTSEEDEMAMLKIESVFDKYMAHPIVHEPPETHELWKNYKLFKDLVNDDIPQNRKEWEYVVNFLKKPYWRRLWILQEITAHPVERRDTIIIGSQGTLNFVCVDALTHLAAWSRLGQPAVHHDDLVKNIRMPNGLVTFETLQKRCESFPLLSLMFVAGTTESTDKRDLIASMLPFSFDTSTPGNVLKVNYAETLEETYVNFVVWYLKQYGALDFLTYCNPVETRRNRILPSWVPDWREGYTSLHQLFVDEHEKEPVPLYKTRIDMPSTQKICRPAELPLALTVSGVRISSINALSQKKLADIMDSQDSEHRNPLCELLQSEVLSRSLCWDATVVVSPGKSSGCSWTRGAYRKFRGLEASEATRNRWSTDLADAHFEPFDDIQQRMPETIFSLPGSSGADVLGIAQAFARQDDELWMLKGGNILYILRPWQVTEDVEIYHLDTAESSLTNSNGSLTVKKGTTVYQYVCEAFVLGLMDGELSDMLGEESTRSRPACLAEMDHDFRTIHLMDKSLLYSE